MSSIFLDKKKTVMIIPSKLCRAVRTKGKGAINPQDLAKYSHLFNKRGGGAKVAKSLNVELGINEKGGIFGTTST